MVNQLTVYSNIYRGRNAYVNVDTIILNIDIMNKLRR